MKRGRNSRSSRGQTTRREQRSDPLAAARQLWQQQRFDEALRALDDAARRAPHDPRVLIEASRGFAQRYEFERAVSLLERAERLGGDHYAIQHAAGENYRLMNWLDQAESCFRQACRLAEHPQSQLELAAICERRHGLDEAEQLASRALAKQPDLGPAEILLARIERRRGEQEQAEARLRSVAESSTHPPQVVAEAWGELATLLDASGQYDAAWQAAVRCKALLLLSGGAWQVASFVLERCRTMVDQLTPEQWRHWAEDSADIEPAEPLAVLTGFPRSGTTLLERVLDAHPGLVSTEEKDLFATVIFPELGRGLPAGHPIVDVLDRLTHSQIKTNRRRYLRAIRAMAGQPLEKRLHLDKNPSLTLMLPALLRVFPELKTIVALRDPRDVVLSCFLRYLPVNPVSVSFLTLQRTADRYLLDLGAWLKMRDMMPAAWIEVRYETLVADLEQTARQTAAFLGLPWRSELLAYREHLHEKPVLSPSYETVAQPIFSAAIGRWRNYERQLAPVLDRLTPLVESLGYDR